MFEVNKNIFVILIYKNGVPQIFLDIVTYFLHCLQINISHQSISDESMHT